MVSNPKMEYQVFLCIFQMNSAMATLGLKEMGKLLRQPKKMSGIMKSGLDAMPLFLLDDLLRLPAAMRCLRTFERFIDRKSQRREGLLISRGPKSYVSCI